MSKPIAIIGFGFSGLMLLANVVREAKEAFELYVVAADLRGLGLAYSTDNTEHLLNVPAGKMSAFANEPSHFYTWLTSAEGKEAALARGVRKIFEQTDFAPRAIYGDYLQSIWKTAQEQAAEKNINIKLVPSKASAITKTADGFAVGTERGDAIAVTKVIITTGNEARPIMRELDPQFVVQDPWAKDALTHVAHSDGPVILLGTGLTAVDMMLSLRSLGYSGQIIGISRRGLLPQGHKHGLKPYTFDEAALKANSTLGQLVTFVRRAINAHEKNGGDWREVIDGLRPYTQMLWMRLSESDQKKFIRCLLPFWNVHRHRMAPEIAAKLDKELKSGGVRIFNCRDTKADMEDGKAKVTLATGRGGKQVFYPSAIINCIGPELRVHPNGQNIFTQMVAERLAEPSKVGIGLASDPTGRLFGEGYPGLFAVGALRTGQLLESTAVPELRGQAADVARAVLS